LVFGFFLFSKTFDQPNIASSREMREMAGSDIPSAMKDRFLWEWLPATSRITARCRSHKKK
jgi:hypothetical protein